MCLLVLLGAAALLVLEVLLIGVAGREVGPGSVAAALFGGFVVGMLVIRLVQPRAWDRVGRAATAGRDVTEPAAGAMLVTLAAVLFMVPGFVTDAVGVLLLLPPVRRTVARAAAARYRQALDDAVHGSGGGPWRVFGVPPSGGGRPGTTAGHGVVEGSVVEGSVVEGSVVEGSVVEGRPGDSDETAGRTPTATEGVVAPRDPDDPTRGGPWT